ncbi:energy-coupled thiamine transporter ThiT [Bacillus sp. AGMB 02131]|uniref:Energy-coupled thiamine transporter ThiT n=1 Tax=Peribacillus faecalis TaxID=2772559 RepID=A0A927HA04_9BACI|nr:energy-coupled thiamine transporter ThiT [Peribacillus faecalis]MBD3108140.1 energy-coupled thiamine transporter ThiT [Peribacillus faecalis]
MKRKTLFLVEVAVFAALAVLLDYVSSIISLRIWPQGGSVSIAMVPIFIMAFRWGLKGGLTTGLLLGALQLVVTQPWIATPVQAFIDYFVAFTVVGFAGVFAKKVQQRFEGGEKTVANAYMVTGILLGSMLRFLCHFATGIIFFGMYAPEDQPIALYSFLYNGSYMLPSAIISGVVVVALYGAASRVLLRKAA